MRLLDNFRIGKRLGIGFGVMLAMMTGGTLLALWGIREVNRTGDLALAKSTQQTWAKEALFNLAESHKHIAFMLSANEAKDRLHEKGEMLEHRQVYHDLLAKLEKEGGQEETPIFEGIRAAVTKFEDLANRVVEAALAEKVEDSWTLNTQEAIPAAEKIEETVAVLLKHIDDDLAVADRHAENWVSNILYTLSGGLVLALVFATGFGWIITRSVTHPLLQVSTILQKVAKGDVSADVDDTLQSRKDEVGELARSIEAMVQGLRTVVSDIISSVQTMASSSGQLTSISADMATGIRETAAKTTSAASATEQVSNNASSVAASVEQATANLTTVAAATEEMTATITEIAGNAEKARSVTHQAAEQADRASASVSNLGDAAQVIGQVTETINAISSQTNLLALNATIEAARAGAAGKGFAVVANEIKELARQTAAATEDIKSKVSAIQSSTGTAVTDINQIAGVVRQVSEIVNTIAAAIEEQSAVTKDIASNIGQASLGVKDANRRVAETTTATRSIAREIADVNQRANKMAEGSEQTLANAAELNQLADQLRVVVARFKINEQTANGSAPAARASVSGVPTGNGSPAASEAGTQPLSATVSAVRSAGKSPKFVEWSDAFSVGVPAMDEHHKRLFDLVNRLHTAMKEGKGKDVVGGVLDELAKYTEYHFTAEEKLMRSHKCSGLKDQEDAHGKFIANVSELQKQFLSGGQALSFETMNMLKDWLVNHIQRKDSPCMAECTKRHGQGPGATRAVTPAKLTPPTRQNTPAQPASPTHAG